MFNKYQDLAGTKPLSQLAKKVPIFNRRDDILRVLCEFDVPVNRGVWLIKMTAAYAAAMQVRISKVLARTNIFNNCLLKYFKTEYRYFLKLLVNSKAPVTT
jgi:hypothetical protein